MSILWLAYALNPTYWVTHMFEEAWGSFDVLGIWKYPLVLVGIIGYVYLATKSGALTALLIIVAFAVFGGTGIFAPTQLLNSFLGTVTILGIAGLFLALLLKKEVSEAVSSR